MSCVNPTQVLNLLQRLVTPKNFVEEAPSHRSLLPRKKRNLDECSVLEGACQQLWDITVEEKVCEFLTGEKMSKGLWLVFEKRLLADPRSDRLLELSVGILANLTCFARSRLVLIKQENVVSLLVQYLMTSSDQGVLNELLRCVHGLVHCIDKKLRKQFLHRIFTKQPCIERILELYSNSLNHDVLYGCILFIYDLVTTVKETRVAEIAGASNFIDCLLENVVMDHNLDDYFDKTFGVLIELTNSRRFPNVAQVVVETLVNTPRVIYTISAHIQNRTPPSLKAFLFLAKIVDHTPNKQHIMPLLDSRLFSALLQARHLPDMNIVALLAIFQRIAAEALNQRAGYFIKVIKDNPEIEKFLKEQCHEPHLDHNEGSAALRKLTSRQQVERTLAKNALHNFAVFLTTVHHSEGGLEKKPEPPPPVVSPPPIPADQMEATEDNTSKEPDSTTATPTTQIGSPEKTTIGPPERPSIGPPERPLIRKRPPIGPPERPPSSRIDKQPKSVFRTIVKRSQNVSGDSVSSSQTSSVDTSGTPVDKQPVMPRKTKDIKPVTRKTQRRRTIATPEIIAPQRSKNRSNTKATAAKKRKASAISKPPSRALPTVLASDRAAVKRKKDQKGKKSKKKS